MTEQITFTEADLKAALTRTKDGYNKVLVLADGTELSCQDHLTIHYATQGVTLEVAAFTADVDFSDLPELGPSVFGVYCWVPYREIADLIAKRGGLADA